MDGHSAHTSSVVDVCVRVGGPRRFAAGSSSDDDDEDDMDHGLGQYDHRMGAGGIDSSDSDDGGEDDGAGHTPPHSCM